jgi:hypothetical protein
MKTQKLSRLAQASHDLTNRRQSNAFENADGPRPVANDLEAGVRLLPSIGAERFQHEKIGAGRE